MKSERAAGRAGVDSLEELDLRNWLDRIQNRYTSKRERERDTDRYTSKREREREREGERETDRQIHEQERERRRGEEQEGLHQRGGKERQNRKNKEGTGVSEKRKQSIDFIASFQQKYIHSSAFALMSAARLLRPSHLS